MQTIWSRVAQTRGSCCCPQCLQTAHGVSRRATASATKRMPKFLTSSTLFYSGIFAAAGTWDAGAKIQRRERWDKAIAEVKTELGQAAEMVGQQRQQETPSASKASETVSWQSDIFAIVEPSEQRPKWPTNTGPELRIHRLPPESIYATDDRKARAGLRKLTPKKLETIMLSIDALQLRIFLEVQREHNKQWRAVASSAVPVDYRDRIFLSEVELRAALDSKLEDLKAICLHDPLLPEWKRSENDMPLSNYRQDDQGTFRDTASRLNSSLRDLFWQHKAHKLDTPSLLAKLAYNLSVSPAPPTVNTYNTLILGLTEAQQHSLVNDTLKSLRVTHTRPNEITNVAALDHFRLTNNAEGFVYWVELMRGKHKGQALAKPDIRITVAGESRLIRVAREGYADKVIQLPYPTPNVFAALIKGVLKFSGFDTALGICEGMGREGWGLCMSGLTPLLIDCTNRGAWDHGLAVWRQIQALKARSGHRDVHGKWIIEQIPLDAYAAMIRLTSKAGQKGVFENVWDQATRTQRKAARMLTEVVKAQNQALKEGAAAQTKVAVSMDDAISIGKTGDAAANLAVHNDASALDLEAEKADPPEATAVPHTLRAEASRIVRNPWSDPDASPQPMQLDVVARGGDGISGLYQSALMRKQLDGVLPPRDEFEVYDLRERTMTIPG